jgi:uncharacterized protein YbcI
VSGLQTNCGARPLSCRAAVEPLRCRTPLGGAPPAHVAFRDLPGAVSVRAMSTTPLDRGRQLSAISNGITRLHRAHYGRGATTVRTIMQRNYVMCVLEDIYTPIERTLIDAGREDAVRQTRSIFQDTMRPQFVQIVEGALGRKVLAFMSQVCFDPDMSAEIFILEPEGDDRAPEAEPLPTAEGTKKDAASGT